MPISLSQGHIRTPEFKVDLESTCFLGLEVRPGFDLERGSRPADVPCLYTLKISWSLSNGERVIASGIGNDPSCRQLGWFDLGKGRYTLDLDVVGDGSRLNAGAPHLVVSETWGIGRREVEDATAGAFLVSLLLAGPGIFVIILGGWKRRAAWARACSLTQPGPQPPLAGTGRPQATQAPAAARPYSWTIDRDRHRKLRLPNVPAFSRLSWFGLLFTMSFVVLGGVAGGFRAAIQVIPVGLAIHLLRPGIPAQSTPWLEPLYVRVAFAGPEVRPKLYLNSQFVSWEDFGTLLQKDLNRRPPHWPVYLEGDPDMEWQHVAKAIDAIRGLQAEVVLLTTATQPHDGANAGRGRLKPIR